MADTELPEKKTKAVTSKSTSRKSRKNGVQKILIDSSSAFYSDLKPVDRNSELIHATIIISPYEKGRITSITVPDMPADFVLLTSKDIPGTNTVKTFNTVMPLLAGEEIHYKGEPLAVLAGPDRKILSALTERVQIELAPEEKTAFLEADETIEQAGNIEKEEGVPSAENAMLPEPLKEQDAIGEAEQTSETAKTAGETAALHEVRDSFPELTEDSSAQNNPTDGPTDGLTGVSTEAADSQMQNGLSQDGSAHTDLLKENNDIAAPVHSADTTGNNADSGNDPHAIPSSENGTDGQTQQPQTDVQRKNENREGILVDLKELITSLEDNLHTSALSENLEKRFEELKEGHRQPEEVTDQTAQDTAEEAPEETDTRPILRERSFCYGDVEKNYKEADFKIHNTFEPRLDFSGITEPEGAYVEYDGESFNVYAPSLWAGHLKKNIASSMNVPEENIRIKQTFISDSSSNSLWYTAVPACLAAMTAAATKKEVLLKVPDTLSDYMKRPVSVTISHKTGVRKDGIITSSDVSITIDAGAFCPLVDYMTDNLAAAAAGAYRPEAIRVRVKAVVTDSFPAVMSTRNIDALAFYAVENQMQDICRETGFSPIEIRTMNLREDREEYPILIDNGELRNVFQELQKASDFNRKYASYSFNPFSVKNTGTLFPSRGIGLAAGFDGKGFYGSSLGFFRHTLEATMEKDGSLTVKSTVPSQILPIWKKYASEILEISPDQVIFSADEEEQDSQDLPDTISGSVYIMTQLLKKCCTGIQKQRFHEPLPITVKKKLIKPRNHSWNNDTFNGTPFYSTSWGAAAAEVEIDALLYKPRIRGIWIVIDAGTILDKRIAETSIRKDIHDVLFRMMEGQTLSADKIYIQFLDSQDEPRQTGSLVRSILPPAIANAISHAIRKSILSIPLSSDYLYREVNT